MAQKEEWNEYKNKNFDSSDSFPLYNIYKIIYIEPFFWLITQRIKSNTLYIYRSKDRIRPPIIEPRRLILAIIQNAFYVGRMKDVMKDVMEWKTSGDDRQDAAEEFRCGICVQKYSRHRFNVDIELYRSLTFSYIIVRSMCVVKICVHILVVSVSVLWVKKKWLPWAPVRSE